MEIIPLDKAKLELIIAELKRGGLNVSPSDTVYGLLTDATNKKAVKKLIEFKNRPIGKPISVFVSDFEMLEKYVEIKQNQRKILQQLLPGPFTVILKSKHKVSPLLESEKGTLGIRISDYEFIIQLVKKFGRPLTATSANLSGQAPHYSIRSLLNELPKKKKALIDLVVDAGELSRNKPSTVVDLTSAQLKIVRRGDIVFKTERTFISSLPLQTKKIAQYIFKKLLDKDCSKPLIFILQGDLGVGKTIFIKGIGDLIGVRNVVSPTFVVYYEYPVVYRCIDTLIHVDLYNVRDPGEFRYLHLENYLKKGILLCFEWGEKAGEIMKVLKSKGKLVYVKMRYIGQRKRQLEINY